MKFQEMFTPVTKGNFGLTEMAIYQSIDRGGYFIPIWGGNKEHATIDRMVSECALTKKGDKITIFNGEGIIVSLDGSAGSMTYKRFGEKFALNHHAGFFTTKLKENPIIDMEFFSIFFKSQLKELSVSEGSKTLTLDKLYDFDFEIPNMNTQLRIMRLVRPVLSTKTGIELLLEKIQKIKSSILSGNYSKFQGVSIPLEHIVECISGNTGLTEQFLYSQIQRPGERTYKILTGSTDYSTNKYIHKSEHPLNSEKFITVVNEKPVIHVVRKGKAGVTAYFPEGNYTTNDDAYLLCLKENSGVDVNLEWLMYALKSDFLDYASSSDNGTWNMSGFFENTKIDLPVIDEQLKVIGKYHVINLIESKLKNVLVRVNDILSKHVVTD